MVSGFLFLSFLVDAGYMSALALLDIFMWRFGFLMDMMDYGWVFVSILLHGMTLYLVSDELMIGNMILLSVRTEIILIYVLFA